MDSFYTWNTTGKQMIISLRGYSHEVCVAATHSGYWKQLINTSSISITSRGKYVPEELKSICNEDDEPSLQLIIQSQYKTDDQQVNHKFIFKMSTIMESKPCQADINGISCEKDARAKCFHCSRDLCLMHLTEHTQIVERQTQTFLYSYEKIFKDLSNKFESLSMSTRIFEYPFIQLEKWRIDAHHKLDQIAEQKRQEIQTTILEYQNILTKKRMKKKQKIELLKKRLNDLSRQTQIVNKDVKYLEDKIDETRYFLQSIEKHSIKVCASAFSVHIRTHFFDTQPSKTSQPTSPVLVQTTNPIRNARPETKELVSNGNKLRFEKKRSLSVALL